MIDWLREDHRNPSVELDGRTLPITIRRHARARRLTMRLAPDGSELRVTLPQWGRTKDALAFAKARREWIAAQLESIPQPLEIAPGLPVPYRGEKFRIDWQEKRPRTPLISQQYLQLGGPLDTVARRIQRWLEKEALRLFACDLAYFCDRADQALPDIKLSRAKRRWGSCTSERDSGRCIRINWRLVMAPDHVRRSVVAHEVAHLTHFDHSPDFHALLDEIYDEDIATADLWLKKQGRSLYAAFG